MKLLKIVCVLVLILGIQELTFSQEAKRIGKISDINGSASIKAFGEKQWQTARIGMILSEGDTLRTDSNSWVSLNLNGIGETATVEVNENSEILLSELVIDEDKGTKKTLLDLAIGEVLIKAKELTGESKFEVKTPTSVVGVRGTKFSVRVEAE